jgi:hypothetical protein
VLSALLRTDTVPASNLFVALKDFASTYALSLAHMSTGYSLPETQALDLNQAFTAIKLWIMLARKTIIRTTQSDTSPPTGSLLGSEASESTGQENVVWNELWPPFETLIIASAAGDAESAITVSRIKGFKQNTFTTLVLHSSRRW